MRVIVEADGGSRGNPGPAGYGAVVLDADTGAVLAERFDALGVTTNNVAEYTGLIEGLSAAAELGADAVAVRMDSKLVVEQLAGRWRVKHPGLQPLYARARELADGFSEISFSWIPREQNSAADRLANRAMDGESWTDTSSRAAAPAQVEPANNNSAWIATDARPTRIVLVRHGVTAYSVEKRFAGRSDLELLPAGLAQAAAAAERVRQLGPIDQVISSPLLRTRQTAAAVAETLRLPVTTEDGLAETDFGRWDGYTFGEIRQSEPEALQRWLSDPGMAPPGGESQRTLGRRVLATRDALLQRFPGQTLALVTHVSPIKTLVVDALAAPESSVHRMYLAPASISVIDYFPDGPISLRAYNDTAHLDGLSA